MKAALDALPWRHTKLLTRYRYLASRPEFVGAFSILGDRLQGLEAYVFGGFLRDSFLGYPPKDIDLVIKTSEAGLQEAFEGLPQRRNFFGGLRVKLAAIDIDVWALEDTWAFKQDGTIPKTFEGLAGTDFLNLNCIVLDLWGDHLIDRGFNVALDTGVLEIAFEPNLSPALCCVRALVLASRTGLLLSRRLKQYIKKHAEVDQDKLLLMQKMRYGREYFSEGKLKAILEGAD